jgi:hypothetical protein
MNIKPYPKNPKYHVSQCGKIIGPRGWQLVTFTTKFGYEVVNIYSSPKKFKSTFVHRLVAHTWCEGYSDGMVVDHIDANKKNNHYTNLEWVTQGENEKRAYALGLKPRKGGVNGWSHNSKLDIEKVLTIKTMKKLIHANELAKIYNVSPVTIRSIWREEIWNWLV